MAEAALHDVLPTMDAQDPLQRTVSCAHPTPPLMDLENVFATPTMTERTALYASTLHSETLHTISKQEELMLTTWMIPDSSIHLTQDHLIKITEVTATTLMESPTALTVALPLLEAPTQQQELLMRIPMTTLSTATTTTIATIVTDMATPTDIQDTAVVTPMSTMMITNMPTMVDISHVTLAVTEDVSAQPTVTVLLVLTIPLRTTMVHVYAMMDGKEMSVRLVSPTAVILNVTDVLDPMPTTVSNV